MPAQPKTGRGRASRERIVEHAAELFAQRGVTATSLDEVLAAAGAGKGQFYHYFRSRDELVEAAVGLRCAQVLAGLTEALSTVTSLAELERALAGFAAGFEQMGLPGCPVGTLATEVAGRNEGARLRAAAAFDAWEQLFADALARMRARGELRADASPEVLATALLASLEGGMVLSQVRKDPASLRIAVEAGLAQVRSTLDRLLPGRWRVCILPAGQQEESMRRLIVSSFVSLDGVIGDPRAWASEYFDEQAVQKSLAVLQRCDAMLMGTSTYEYFAPAWSAATDPYGARITAMPKYVFSASLTSAEWNNTIIVSADAVVAAAELKKQDGGDLIMYGYGRLAQAFLEHGLVDELNIGIHPVIVGRGTPLFRPGLSTVMQLTAVERSATGVVSLTYSA